MRLSEFLIDPSTCKLSASRLCLLVLVVVIVPAFLYACARGWLAVGYVSPIATMLGVVVGAVCGVYGVSTYTSGGGGVQTFLSTTACKAKPAPPEGG